MKITNKYISAPEMQRTLLQRLHTISRENQEAKRPNLWIHRGKSLAVLRIYGRKYGYIPTGISHRSRGQA